MTPEQVLEAVKATISPLRFCTLITIGEDGHPSARLMQHFAPQDDLTIWFGTHPDSRKVIEITKDNRMTIIFHSLPDNGYVTLCGTARLENKLEKRQVLWYDDWGAFYEGGPGGDAYMLIEFTPTRIEILNFARNITPPPYGIAHANLIRDGDSWVLDG